MYAVLSAPTVKARDGARFGRAVYEEVFLLGFGVYVEDEVPPEPMGVVRALFRATTWEEFDRVVAEDTGQPPNPGARPTNPKIVLDDDAVVWGAECWWGPEPLYAQFRGNRREQRCSIVAERGAAAARQSAIKTHVPLMHGDLRFFTDGTWHPRSPAVTQIPTPVGERCPACEVPIQADDYGVSMVHMEGSSGAYRPWHLTCFRSALGIEDTKA